MARVHHHYGSCTIMVTLHHGACDYPDLLSRASKTPFPSRMPKLVGYFLAVKDCLGGGGGLIRLPSFMHPL